MASLPFSSFGQDTRALLKRVDAHYNHLSTLQARFVERFAGLGTVREEFGTLLLAKPGRMRWSYDKPAGKVYVLDQQYGWSYTPGDAQVQRIAAKKLNDLRSPLRFLLGRTALARELTSIDVTPASGGFFQIAGEPRALASKVNRLILLVDSAGMIHSMRLMEVDGSETEFTFAEVKENDPVEAGAFVFVVPRGVRVVEGQPPV